MEDIKQPKVMVSGFLKLLVIFVAVSTVSGSICPQGKKFLHEELQACVNCTICDSEKGHVVLRPCEIHRDTICGPLSELTKNWKLTENRHRHRHHHENRDKKLYFNIGQEQESHKNDDNIVADARTDEVKLKSEPESSEAPFSTAETLIWDWQAIALTLAVFTCILFFLVIALYSLHQAKQWRRLKENFEADVEELSARLSLMAASNADEKGDALEARMSPIHDGNYLKNRCVYLEELLNVRKDTKIGSDTGNVYIEESNPNGKT